MEVRPDFGHFRQLRRRHTRAIEFFDQRLKIAITQVVGLTGKERADLVELVPGGAAGLIVGQGKTQEQAAAVAQLIFVAEINAAVPHHGAEIGFHARAARVVTARLVLAVILINFILGKLHEKRGQGNAIGLTNQGQFLLSGLSDFFRKLKIFIQKGVGNGHKREIDYGSLLKVTAFQLFKLLLHDFQKLFTQSLQLISKVMILT